MLKKLRRERKDSAIDVSPSDSRAGSNLTVSISMGTTTGAEESTSRRAGVSFFDLPAELRNEIYEFVISDATLSLPSTLLSGQKKPKLRLKKRRSSTTAPINGLLLASRQCRKEYLSVLLSTISVVVEIKDFDFDNLTRVSSTLAPSDLESLQTNPNLVLHLHTRNCTQKSLSQLRAWLDFRASQRPAQKLPWRYEFPLHRLLPPTTMGRVRLLRELEYYADSIATLADFASSVPAGEGRMAQAGQSQKALAAESRKALASEGGMEGGKGKEVDDGERRAELAKVIHAHEEKAQWLEDDLEWLGQRHKSMAVHARGLAGGGLR